MTDTMYLYDRGMSGWGYAVMTLGVAFWALVAIAFLALLRRPAAAPSREVTPPRQLLAERFARGEIDDDEYYRRLSVLDYDADRPPKEI